MKAAPPGRRVPLAVVHHANQYLITDGYDNRQGISEVVEGYAAALRLHEKYGIPANLHLSGTLIETAAWHCPQFLALVRALMEKGLLCPIGGTYAENVMTLFSPSFNIRQLNEHLWLYRHHLGCPPARVKVCWLPERVWDTALLAPVLTSKRLANGGYRFVLVDDRLLYPTNGSYTGSARAQFDSAGPYGPVAATYSTGPSGGTGGLSPVEASKVYTIAEGNGLAALPISANLRYWVPPLFPDHWRSLEETVELLAREGDEDTMLVYADDLEKTAGVGGWDASALERYDAFLRWTASRGDVTPVLLSDWLADRPLRGERVVQRGTFFELAQAWNAGEGYRGWWESDSWSPYRRYLALAEDAVRSAEREGAERRLLELAWKHLLASSYETAWHDPDGGSRAPAPWAKAVASHARACLAIAAAARWFARGERQASVEAIDIDEDGDEEVVVRNECLYAVMAPRYGGRLVYLFGLTPEGGALLIGNPSDDWNFQEELNRYMDRPSNHPGAGADVEFEHDRYQASALGVEDGHAFVQMTNAQEGSRLHGAHKSFLLSPDWPALVVCYRLPDGVDTPEVESCLSPDYYRLLREGRGDLSPYGGEAWRGFRNGDIAVWLGLAADEDTGWAEPAQREAGHGLNLRLQSRARHFHLLIGCGDTDAERCRKLMHWGRNTLHRMAETAGAVSTESAEVYR